MNPLSSFPFTDSVLIKVSSFLILRLFFRKTFLLDECTQHSWPRERRERRNAPHFQRGTPIRVETLALGKWKMRRSRWFFCWTLRQYRIKSDFLMNFYQRRQNNNWKVVEYDLQRQKKLKLTDAWQVTCKPRRIDVRSVVNSAQAYHTDEWYHVAGDSVAVIPNGRCWKLFRD